MRPFDPAVRPLLRPGRWALAGVVAAAVIQSVLLVGQAYLVSGLIVAVVEGRDTGAWVLWVAIAFAARALTGWASDLLAARAAGQVGMALRSRLLAHAVSLGPLWLSRRRTGEVVALATRGVAATEPYLTRFLPALLVAAVLPVLTVIAIATQDLLSAVIVVVTLPLLPLFAILVGWSTRARAERQWRALSALAGHFVDVVKGLPTLVAYRRADAQASRIREITDRHRRATIHTLRLAFASSAVLELVATISVALVAVSVGLRLAEGDLGLSTALTVLLLASEAYWPLRRVGAEFHAAAEGGAALARAVAVLDEQPSRKGRLVVPDLRAATIELREVTHTYEGLPGPALSPVTETVAPGEFVAVTGPSGAGKSTLLAVLAGQLRATSGSVAVGGVPLDDLDRAAWTAGIAWVPQRPWLMAGSVAANLRVGRPEASEADLWAALREVELADRVAAAGGGLEAEVGEDGIDLSAGERARLTIARAVLSGRPLLLLDEPSAHLDPGTEAAMLDALRRVAGSRTVVVVTHRADVFQAADRVIDVRPPPAGGAAMPAGAVRQPSASVVVEGDAAAIDQADQPAVDAARLVAAGATPEPTGSVASRLAGGWLLGALSAASGVALTATAGWLIVRASERPPVLMLLVAIIAVRTFGIARPVLRYAERLVSHDAALRELAAKRAEVYAALVPLTPGALGRRRGDVLASVVDDVDAHVDRRLRVWGPVTSAVLVAVVSALVAGWILASAAAVVAFLAVVGAATFWVAGRAVDRAERTFVIERATVSEQVEAVCAGASDLVMWSAAGRALQTVERTGARLAAAARTSARGLGAARAGVLVATGISIVAMGDVAAGALASQRISPAAAALLMLLPLGLLEVVLPLAEAGAVAARARQAVGRLDALATTEPAVTQDPSAKPLAALVPAGTAGSLESRAVTAGWGASPVLRGFDLTLTAGDRVGIVGPSGSGKSTLAALLMRYLDPTAGQIRLDGVDLRRLRIDDVRRIVALVDDDPYVFSSSLVENVRFARPTAGDAEVEAALRAARLGAWVDTLPEGVHTRLGDGARDVSGGERARIGLARALLTDAAVLVLDEPTAHLDGATATAVTDDLLGAASGRSLVLITHRREGLQHLDHVVSLDSGRAPSAERLSSVPADGSTSPAGSAAAAVS